MLCPLSQGVQRAGVDVRNPATFLPGRLLYLAQRGTAIAREHQHLNDVAGCRPELLQNRMDPVDKHRFPLPGAMLALD